MAVKSRENVRCFHKNYLEKQCFYRKLKGMQSLKLGQYERAVSFFNRRRTFSVKWTPKIKFKRAG